MMTSFMFAKKTNKIKHCLITVTFQKIYGSFRQYKVFWIITVQHVG